MARRGSATRKASEAAVHAVLPQEYLDGRYAAVRRHHNFDFLHYESVAG